MRKVPLWIVTIAMFVVGAIFFSWQTMEKPAVAKPGAAIIAPKVTLDMVEVTQYYGYWYFSNKVKPTKGKAGNYGAPLPMAFIFNIENPNKEPVELTGFKFTIAFDEFDVNTVMATEAQWIPGGKTNQLRVQAMFDVRQTLLTLLLPGAMQLKKKGITPWQQLEEWWVGAPNMSFPIHVKEGAATFEMDGQVKVVPFTGTFGG
jgi:hypothetical protein